MFLVCPLSVNPAPLLWRDPDLGPPLRPCGFLHGLGVGDLGMLGGCAFDGLASDFARDRLLLRAMGPLP
jgi:hypothetical protein